VTYKPLTTILLFSLSLTAKVPTRRPAVHAAGTASVFATPDQVIIDVTITNRGNTAQDTAAQNATQVAAVIAALTQLLGPGADIRTINYFIGPYYQYPPNGGTPTLLGYTASNTVEVKLSDIAMAGPTIDKAIGAGATTVGGLRFALKDSEPSRQQALRLATVQARTHAEAMAGALGKSVGAVILLQEGVEVKTPIVFTAAAGDASAQTSVQPGKIEVQATVTLDAELN
jgi:uncharacterized protein YggE